MWFPFLFLLSILLNPQITLCNAGEDDIFNQTSSLIIKPNDPRILKLIRRFHLVHPSNEPYQLNTPFSNPTRIVEAVRDISLSMKNGFFVDIGAHDGEWSSNTLELEMHHGWTGILVEPNPFLFDSLVAKRRKCWATDTCIFNSPKPIKLRYLHHDRYPSNGKVLGPNADHGTMLEDKFMQKENYLDEGDDVSCFPLESLLYAVNQSSVVDFISLDVVGNELAVLESIPLEKLGVKFIVVGHVDRPNSKILLTNYLRGRGYSFIAEAIFHLYFKKKLLIHLLENKTTTIFLN